MKESKKMSYVEKFVFFLLLFSLLIGSLGFSLSFFLPQRSRIGRKNTLNYFYFLTNVVGFRSLVEKNQPIGR